MIVNTGVGMGIRGLTPGNQQVYAPDSSLLSESVASRSGRVALMPTPPTTPKKPLQSHSHIKPVPKSGSLPSPPKPQSKYRADEFIIPAHDENGGSISYAWRGDKRYGAIASEVVWSRRYPYKTPSDIYRHAIDRHFAWLSSLESQNPMPSRDSMAQLTIIKDGIQKAEFAVEFGDSITALERTVAKLVSRKLRGMAAQLVYSIRKQARGIEHPLLRELYLEEIKTRFGHLFNSGGTDGAIGLGEQVEESTPDEEAMHRGWGYESGNGNGDRDGDGDGDPE